VYTGPVKVTLTGTDASPGSGVAGTFYKLGNTPYIKYSAPFTESATGTYTMHFYTSDNANNSEAVRTVTFAIKGQTATAVATSLTTSTYHQGVTFTATVTASYGGPANGTVNFKDGAKLMGSATLSSGKAFFPTSALGAGVHSITAVLPTNANFLGSTSPAISQTVNKAATTTKLASSLNPSTHGTAVTFTATVTGAFGGATSGSVTFKNGTTAIGTTSIDTSTHQAKLTTTTLSVGTHSISASYPGNANYKASTSSVLSQVVK
jgi:hypothetical protein